MWVLCGRDSRFRLPSLMRIASHLASIQLQAVDLDSVEAWLCALLVQI